MPALTTAPELLEYKFRSLKTARNVAALLEVEYSILVYYLYRRPITTNYRTFTLQKKSGGERIIHAPITALKVLQSNLNAILKQVYKPKPCVQGYVGNRSVLSNAQTHIRRGVLINVDLQDFFPSINFGRVRGMFMAWPYHIPTEAATILAQICCVNGHLAQGAPTSPIVSNMICGKLDSDLLRLARRFRCTYTRYADDITFSTTRNKLPSPIGKLVDGDESTTAEAGELLRDTIEGNGFRIKHPKTRIQRRSTRQEVTGLIVNETPNVKRHYVRQIRAMIHAIQKYGLEKAETEFHFRYYTKQIHRDRALPPMLRVLEGKLNYLRMVKGEADVVYRRLYNRYLVATGNPPEYITDPLHDVASALWVLESEEPIGQGTAFMLKDYGLITCSHVLTPTMKAFKHDAITKKYDIKIVAQNEELDVAILKKPKDDAIELEIGNPDSVKQGDRLILAGFPNYRFGDSAYITGAKVAGFRIISTQRWFLLNAPIIAGNSGGVVLDQEGKVVGIAATGADHMGKAHETEHHGVIPITALNLVS